MFAREAAMKLAFCEWGEVTSLLFYLSQRLLNDDNKAGIKVSDTVNERLRTRN